MKQAKTQITGYYIWQFDKLYYWCHHRQIRCDNSCPLQKYTPNDVIVSKFEQLAQKFPQTAKLIEVRQKVIITPSQFSRSTLSLLQVSNFTFSGLQFLLFQVGKSSLGQRIVGLRISDNVQKQRKLLKPMVWVKILNNVKKLPGAFLWQHAWQWASWSGVASPPCLLPATCQANKQM